MNKQEIAQEVKALYKRFHAGMTELLGHENWRTELSVYPATFGERTSAAEAQELAEILMDILETVNRLEHTPDPELGNAYISGGDWTDGNTFHLSYKADKEAEERAERVG